MGDCFARGGGRNGELGYGTTKKSSANPDVVAPLTGTLVAAVSAGAGHSVFLIDPDADPAPAAALPVVEPDDAPGGKASAGAGGGKASAGAGGGKRGKADAGKEGGAPAAKKGKKK